MRCHYGLPATMLLALTGLLDRVALAQDESGEWVHLGPPGPGPITALAVNPSWPDEPLVLAGRGDHLVRTRDGGAFWQRFSAPAARLSRLTLAPAYGGLAPAFAAAEVADGWGVFHSRDAGESWRLVVETSGPPELSISPDFAADGLALLVGGGRLYRGLDGGTTRVGISPAAGARVQQAAFSPAFAQDRTIFLAMTSGGFSSVYGDGPRMAHRPTTRPVWAYWRRRTAGSPGQAARTGWSSTAGPIATSSGWRSRRRLSRTRCSSLTPGARRSRMFVWPTAAV